MQNTSQTIVIHQNSLLTRVAVMQGDRLLELYSQWSDQTIFHEQIIAAQVDRVMPNLQAAFVDIAANKNGFLAARELKPSTTSSIEQVLHPSQKILVQVIREPNKNKGALLTQNLRFVSGYLVYFPYQDGVRVSSKIAEQNQELQSALQHLINEQQVTGGFVLRTNAQSATQTEIIDSAERLIQSWKNIQQQFKTAAPAEILQSSATVIDRVLRDVNPSRVTTIEVESQSLLESLELKIADHYPSLKSKLKLVAKTPNLLESYKIPDQWQAALEPVVNLDSGVRVSINHTEAMTVIDVDSGAFSDKTKSHDTRYQINSQAAVAIAEQLRLRNIGGIIAIDFIDMPKPEQAERLVEELRRHLQHDRSPCKVLPMSEFGVVELSRAQIGPSLWQQFGQNCMSCSQAQVKSLQAVCMQINDVVELAFAKQPTGSLTLQVAPEIKSKLEKLNCFEPNKITINAKPSFAYQQFDIVYG